MLQLRKTSGLPYLGSLVLSVATGGKEKDMGRNSGHVTVLKIILP